MCAESRSTSTQNYFSATTPTPNTGQTILIVEDYSDTRAMLSLLLKSNGYKVVEAEDGIEGILKAGNLYPDLIIMDLSLPEMDGVEATTRIHAQGKLSGIPIFVISAYLTDEVKKAALEAGCAEVFRKPLDSDVLIERINATLRSP